MIFGDKNTSCCMQVHAEKIRVERWKFPVINPTNRDIEAVSNKADAFKSSGIG
jgi:hypothetical protein